jgi:hypothetical protein
MKKTKTWINSVWTEATDTFVELVTIPPLLWSYLRSRMREWQYNFLTKDYDRKQKEMAVREERLKQIQGPPSAKDSHEDPQIQRKGVH